MSEGSNDKDEVKGKNDAQRADEAEPGLPTQEEQVASPSPDDSAAKEAPKPTAPQYEFGEEHNEVFNRLAGAMKWVGYIFMGLAVFWLLWAVHQATAGHLGSAVGHAVPAVLILLTGIWTRTAAKYVRAIVRTAGSDITNLMSAMREMLALYTLQKWVFGMTIVVFGVFVVGMLLTRLL